MPMFKLTAHDLMAFCVLTFAYCTLSVASDAPASAIAEKEIAQLIERVAQSPCLFERNEQKHLSADAAQHLHRKWDSAKKKVGSAERFIEQIASKSSVSGKQYLIHCPNKAPETSQQWFTRELNHLRLPVN